MYFWSKIHLVAVIIYLLLSLICRFCVKDSCVNIHKEWCLYDLYWSPLFCFYIDNLFSLFFFIGLEEIYQFYWWCFSKEWAFGFIDFLYLSFFCFIDLCSLLYCFYLSIHYGVSSFFNFLKWKLGFHWSWYYFYLNYKLLKFWISL